MLLVVLFAVQAIFAMLRAWLFTVAGERIVADLRTRLFSAILDQDVEFFDQRRTGELTNRLAADTTVLQNTVTVNVSMALRHALGAVGGIALLAWMSPRMTVVAMAIVPIGVVIALDLRQDVPQARDQGAGRARGRDRGRRRGDLGHPHRALVRARGAGGRALRRGRSTRASASPPSRRS